MGALTATRLESVPVAAVGGTGVGRCNPTAMAWPTIGRDPTERGSVMTTPERTPAATGVVYDLEGTLLEACSCLAVCPCWVGQDPDGGSCDAVNAYRFERGTIRGVDVSGLSFINVVHIPGNVLVPGSWQVVSFVDDRASDAQFEAILDAYHGRLGGPLADLAGLVGEVMAVERTPIIHEIREGRGSLRIGEVVSAEMEPFCGPDGTLTTLRDSLFSTVPGSPAYVAQASHHRVDLPRHGMVWSFEGRNAIQSDYRISYTAEP